MVELTLTDLQVGHTYRAKRVRSPDRTILWLGEGLDSRSRTYTDMVQYDSDNVRDGRHYPKTSAVAFLKWAKEEVKEDE